LKNDAEIGIGNHNTFGQQQYQPQLLGLARRLVPVQAAR
jgi:hypothetical protein